MEQYDIIKELGAGSFGRVVKAKKNNHEFDEYVAIKMIKMSSLSDKQKDAALNQIRLLASITSPNVVQYYDAFFDQSSQNLCIVMEYADGGDLAGMISKKRQKNQRFNENFIWQVAHDLLKALKMLHSNKIIHRDLKPGNVFFVDGVAKLGDLNISKVMEGNFASTQAGTPYYTSPQIWNGQLYDGKCDIWSLGCLLYQIAALRPPFLANDFPNLSKKINVGIFDPIPSFYSKRLFDMIRSCLKVNMRERPSAVDLLQDSVFQYMQTSEQGSVNLLNTIRCPRILRLIQQKLPEAKSPKKFHDSTGEDNMIYIPNSQLKKIVSQEKYKGGKGIGIGRISIREKQNDRSKSRSKVSIREETNNKQSRGIIYRMQSPNPYTRPVVNSPTIYRRIM